MLSFYQDDLLPASSFSEFYDVAGRIIHVIFDDLFVYNIGVIQQQMVVNFKNINMYRIATGLLHIMKRMNIIFSL